MRNATDWDRPYKFKLYYRFLEILKQGAPTSVAVSADTFLRRDAPVVSRLPFWEGMVENPAYINKIVMYIEHVHHISLAYKHIFQKEVRNCEDN